MKVERRSLGVCVKLARDKCKPRTVSVFILLCETQGSFPGNNLPLNVKLFHQKGLTQYFLSSVAREATQH